jgi:hypothetical protein
MLLLLFCFVLKFSSIIVPPISGRQGVKNLVVVPISFVSEHVETLEEIDIEYRELAEKSGVARWRRCPALNLDEDFILELAGMVNDALCEPVRTVAETCVQNNCDVALRDLQQTDTSLSQQFLGAVSSLWDKLGL